MKNIEELHKLCDKVMDSIMDSNRKLEKESERLSAEDAKYLESLTRILKSVTTVIAMEDYDGYSKDGYSRDGWADPDHMNPYHGYSGRRYYRDGMGRFTSYR